MSNNGGTGQKTKKIEQVLNLVSSFDSYFFRGFALIFLFLVEGALIVAIFYNIKIEAGLMTAITIIAVLPILVIRVFDISVLNLSKDGFEAQMLQEQINDVFSKVDRLFVLSMSDSLHKLLSSINGEMPFSYKIDDNKKRHLSYLEDVGYISYETPLPDEVDDLRKYVKITKTGKEFLELRSSIKE